MPADLERTCCGANEYCENMAGISKALEFPSEVVFQRVKNSLEVQQHLQRQLDDLLQQLLQLASTLQCFAEHNRDVSQQLQHAYGATSKVAEKLMLAHCEQELAQRARIASETRATVQLPPFAQVMQQISDHVRQEFIAMSALYAQPAQSAPSTAFTCDRQPIGVTPPGCHQPHPAFTHSLVPWTNPHEQPVYEIDTRLEPQPFCQAQMLSGRPPFMQSQSILGQQHTSPQQLFSDTHSRPAWQHQAFVPAGQPAVEHLQAQPTDISFAPEAVAACRQLGTQAPGVGSSSLQHASPACGGSPWQHNALTLPQSSSPPLHHAPLPAAAASTAPALCQPHLAVLPQQAAALGASLHQGDLPAAQSAIVRQLSELVRCPSQSMPYPHHPTSHVSPTSRGTGPMGAATRFADSLEGQMNRQSVSFAMPFVQGSPVDSPQPSLLQLQQPATAARQQQQQSSLPLASGKYAPSSFPASQQLGAPGKPGPAPLPGSHPTGAAAPSRAAGLTSLLGTREQGQPAILPLATAATCDALAPTPSTHAAVSIHSAAAASHTAAPPTHHSHSRPASLPVPEYPASPADVVKPSTVPQSIAWPGKLLAAASLPSQDLSSPSSMPGQATPLDTSPQLRQTTHACASTEILPAAALLPDGMGQARISTEQMASDASFRFQPQPDCIQVSAGVCCTPVLRPRSHAGTVLPAVAVTSTSEGTGRSPQQEVVIPDSEGSPEGCSPQRQEAHVASPPPSRRPIETLGNGMTDTHLVTLQHSLAQHKVARHSSSSHNRSGCSLEALPRGSQPEVCTQSVHAEQHTGPAQGCGAHSQAASQQQTCPPQSMSFAAAFLRHDAYEGAQPRVPAAEGVSSRMAAESSAWPGMDPNTSDRPPQNITFSRRSGGKHPLRPAQQAVSSVQHTDISLPGSVSPLAPAPAGPVEHLGGDKSATGLGGAAPTGCDDQQGGVQGPVREQAEAVDGLELSNRAHPLDGSQPSSSSLKRVPETPDSAENRSQPTQSPDPPESPQRAAAQNGPLHVVLINNSDEQAGTQGVNVAAFLLMDSQKDSTSPGHSRSAQPAQCPQQGTVRPATSAGFGNSQTQQAPTVHASKTGTGHDTSQMKVSVGPQLLQQQASQAVRASDPDQLAMQAAPAVAAKTPLPKLHSETTPPQTCQADMPAGVTACKQPAGRQRAPRWPGSCSQGAVANANHLHGVAATVVTAQRSKSCSAGGRQHTAKKLVFQQLSLAQQSSLQSPGEPVPGFRASLATAAGSDAKAEAAPQPLAHKKATTTGAVAHPELRTRQEIVRPVASQAGGKLEEAGVVLVPPAVSKAKADIPAAAEVFQKPCSTVSVSQPTESEGQGPHTQTDNGNTGSQEQWETAVSKLRNLAEKHSQDSQEGGAMESATDTGPASGPVQEHRPRPPDEQPLARKGPSASPSLPVASSPRHVQQGRQQQVARPGRPAAQAAALPSTAGQPGQSPIDKSGTGAHACQGELVTKAGREGYTGLSRLRAFMRQQKQQHVKSDPLMDTGQKAFTVATVAAEAQSPTGAPQLGQQPPQQVSGMEHKLHSVVAEGHAEKRHKRKRHEAGACDQVKPHTAEAAPHMPLAGAQCKRHCLSAASPEPSQSPAAHACHQAERPSLVYGKHPTGAAHPPSPNAPHHSGSPQAGSTGMFLPRAPLVAWPVGCEPIQAPALQQDSQQLHPALPVAKAIGRKDQPVKAAADGTTVTACATEAAAEVLVGRASGVPLVGEPAERAPGGYPSLLPGGSDPTSQPSVGQQDKSQGSSEAQQGGLRLDLSSEEDPLLCTQKLPSSQGGSGQGLFKTPDDDVPSKAQGASLVQAAPAGLANMQSPWNTPVLLQPPISQAPDPASICKPPGSIIHRTDGGHPAPPLSWAGSREAALASCTVPRSTSDGSVKHGRCKLSQCQPAAQLTSKSQRNAQMCHEQCPAAAS